MKYTKKLIALSSLMLINTATFAVPSNEELFQMILDLKKEVADSKNRETELKSNLDKTKNELLVAKKQLNELPKTTTVNTKAPSEPTQPLIPNAKEGYTVSAGALVLTEDSHPYPNSNGNYDAGFQIAGNYQSKNNWDYALKFKNFTLNTDLGDTTSGTTKSRIELNILDLEVGKLFSISDNLGLRMSGGIRSAIGNSSLIYKLSNYYSPSTSTIYKNNYFGIGPRITGTPIWKPFSNDFRVFGNFGASFLMGSSGSNYDYSARNLVLEAGSGIGYTFKTNPYNIDLQTGYQLESWGSSVGTSFSGYHGPYANVGVKF